MIKKQYSAIPIFVQNQEELLKIKNNYTQYTTMQYNCTNCGTFFNKKLYLLKRCNYQLLCSTCLLKKTCLERYGVAFPGQLESAKEKSRQTCLKKYGVMNPNQSKEIQEKKKQNCLKKYGTEHPWKNTEVKEKAKQTCLKKYGVENPSQAQKIKEKKKQTCLQHYGVTNPTYISSHNEKVQQTCLKKYGVTNPTYLPDHKEKVEQAWANKTTEELKQIRSKSVKKYFYKDQSFDSSWELAVWIWAIETGKQIKREPTVFKYVHKSKIHYYYPDFVIDGQLVEVKGEHFFNKRGEMQHPFEHDLDSLYKAKHRCGLQHNVQFWRKKDLDPIINWIEEKHGKNWLQQICT